jgi:hypothetical protein
MHWKIASILTLILLGGFPAEQTKQPQAWNAKNIEWQKTDPDGTTKCARFWRKRIKMAFERRNEKLNAASSRSTSRFKEPIAQPFARRIGKGEG